MQYGMKNGSVVSLWHRAVTHSHRASTQKFMAKPTFEFHFHRANEVTDTKWIVKKDAFLTTLSTHFFCLSLFKWTTNASINVLGSSYRVEKKPFLRFNAMHFTHTDHHHHHLRCVAWESHTLSKRHIECHQLSYFNQLIFHLQRFPCAARNSITTANIIPAQKPNKLFRCVLPGYRAKVVSHSADWPRPHAHTHNPSTWKRIRLRGEKKYD